MTKLSIQQARKLALASQGLLSKRPFGAGRNGALAAIRHLGYIQIDSISVIERAHHHALWTRVPGYRVQHLDELQIKTRQIFEYWSHAAAYLPIEDYRFCLPRMHAIASGEKHWFEPDRKLMREVLARIKQEGALMARDFEPPKDRKPGPWWQWKPAKKALEQLFIEGKLMVVHRNGFQKVYDLPERVLPAGINTTMPSTEEYSRFLIERAIRANGLVTAPEISYQRKGAKQSVRQTLQEMVHAGEILHVQVRGSEQTWYTTGAQLESLAKLRRSNSLRLVCPFDNAIIQRKRIQELFDFDYQVECYVPASKRKYGYYCLPILWQSKLVGRLDPKADRPGKVLIIKTVTFEPKFGDIDAIAAPLGRRLQDLAGFNGCDQVVLERVEPAVFREALRSYK